MRMSNEDYDLMLGCILENITAPSPTASPQAGKGAAPGKKKSKTKGSILLKSTSDDFYGVSVAVL